MQKQFHNILAWGDEEEELSSVQAKFVDYFQKNCDVLDLGSGRGVFLELLKKYSRNGIGVEMDMAMYKLSKKVGLNVVHTDALSYLRKTKRKFGGIFASHIIEHMDIKEGIEFIELIKSKLKKGGTAIVITPRPGSLWATENFWLDTTHVRPYPYNLMAKLFQPLKVIEGGIEPDSYVLKDVGFRDRFVGKLRRIILGKELFDFVYGGGVWYIIVKKI